jgi:cytochrome d ubiquinol oxidase subunit I
VDALALSRLQFAFTVMFHYLFPPLTIGLSVVLVYLMWRYARTGSAVYESAARFWTAIFGLNFAVGVASGIVMEFEFGTNWAVYSRYVGDVFGSALAAEGIFAFFLESGFLALLLFGWGRISPRLHLFAALMVSIGGIFSSVWITVANSWQQTPAGYHLAEHVVNERVFTRAQITDFWALVFNPSSIDRLVHVWLGAFVLGGFFVMSISAWYLLHGRHTDFARRSFRGALVLATVSSLLILVSGHSNAQMVAQHQPAKLAAFEGHYRGGANADLHLFGWPDDEAGEVRHGLAVPGMLSWLVHGDRAGVVPGITELEPRFGRPHVWLSFQSFHLMVALGVLFIVSTLYACVQWRRGRLFEQRWLLWYFVFAVVPAFIANEMGWVAAEVGRQPWIVYPQFDASGAMTVGLRTADALSEVVTAPQVMGSMIMFGLIYALLFVVWVVVLHHKIQVGPKPAAGV